MSDGNPPSFFRSWERMWEVLSFITLLLGILVFLIAPFGGVTQTDGTYLLAISVVSVLQAIYFDRKALETEARQAEGHPAS